jgi:hypothetical protein
VAISRVSSASAQATTIILPTHQAGDLIFMFAARNNTTAATVPSGWVTLLSAGASGVATVAGFKVAQSSSEISGTWTNASSLHCAVYRGSVGVVLPSLGVSSGSGTGTSVGYTQLQNYRVGVDDNWYIGAAIMLNSANSLETAPTGMTNINFESSTGVWKAALHDTNASQLSNWATTNVTVTNSAVWRTFTAQLFEVKAPAFGGGGGSYSPIDNILIG